MTYECKPPGMKCLQEEGVNLQPCELAKLIPKEKLEYLFEHSTAGAELDFTFLGFENVYKDVLSYVPKDKTIIDLGCGYAAQSYYFRDYNKYIGVDVFGNSDSVIHTENSEFYFMSIQKFIKVILPSLNLDLKDAFAICSYVPDDEAREMVIETFPYCKVYYPGLISKITPPEAEAPKPSLKSLIRSAKGKTSSTSHNQIVQTRERIIKEKRETNARYT